MRILLIAFALLLPSAAVSSAPPAAAKGSPASVAVWIQLELDEIAAHRTNPPRAARALALLSVAMLDASSVGHNQKPSIAGAAATVLTYLFPDRAALFEAPLERARPRSAVERGRRIGTRVVARARRDGSDRVWQGTVPVGPGLWVPTPPAFAAPLEPLAGIWRTWHLGSPARFRPGPPPRFGGHRYERELREVYDVSRSLTDEQKRIVAFWADGPGTVTPPGHWNQIALDLIASHQLSTRSAARVFALLNTVQADAFIACWDAKYTYWSERPVTAIRRELDPEWLPYIPTPPFPGYVSGHSTTSGAASTVLAYLFPKDAARLRTWADEAAVSRLYGGIHFRTDNEAGLRLGRRIGRAALAKTWRGAAGR